MRLSAETEAEILRLHHAEQWRIGTIARQLGIHHDAVRRVLAQAGTPSPTVTRARKVDPYLGFLREKLGDYPRVPASVLFNMCRERGYLGSERQLRQIVRSLRPRPAAEAYLRLRTLPGEQGQIDWGHFGRLKIGATERPLYAFVAVLSWSRYLFVRFFLEIGMRAFLQGHLDAFQAFGGVPRVLLYDNLKSAVLERRGAAIRFNPELLHFSAHYRYAPRPVAVARGNEKGRVERAIRYLRSSFIPARKWRDLEDLNRQAEAWCLGPAMARKWPDDVTRTVAEAFAEEKAHLLPLPEAVYPVAQRKVVSIGKTPYVRFDCNDYSVPHNKVRRILTVLATDTQVRILEGNDVVADHVRNWGKRERIEDNRHLAALQEEKRQARKHRAMDRLICAVPCIEPWLQGLAERGGSLGRATQRLVALLDLYGPAALDNAVREAIGKECFSTGAIGFLLEKSKPRRPHPPALPIHLPEHPGLLNLSVESHDLAIYDVIPEEEGESNESE